MAQTYAIILAGGSGRRLKRDVPKQFLPLGDKPVLAWSLLACNGLAEVDHILLVTPSEFITRADDIARKYNIHKVSKIIPGGATRQESALNALKSYDFQESDILVYHDAARPFIKRDILRNCIIAVKRHGAAAVYIPVQDTVAEVIDGFVASVPPRDRFHAAQTPQAFRYSIIRTAHADALSAGFQATDDASLALNAGFTVKMVGGDHLNFKITTDFDYRCACLLAENIVAQNSE
ncbi:MAG: 2-C-methyl-D-erythritol 4-phosphate cytidylyltransferase [Spirochaetes bacterium RBG_16_49_21]|nr:MAG: 2-C-methyl-D-erythritol 4-phosphate cytidylyltransferase [Spirochaetes bacterium RBG_16_49_21]